MIARSRSLGGFALLGMMMGVASAQAVTVFPASQCHGCNAEQMRAKAVNAQGLGLAFVYDLDAGVIRKYNRYLDAASAAAAQQLTQTEADATTGEALDAVAASARKEAEEMSGDPTVQEIFAALTSVARANPDLVNFGRDRIAVEALGNDPLTGGAFDLPGVAFAAPQGSYGRFISAMRSAFDSRGSLALVDAHLADLLFDVNLKSAGVSIGIAGNNQGAGATATGTIQWDAGAVREIEVCDRVLNCAGFSVSVAPGHISLEYLGVWDLYHNQYPSPGLRQPATPRWEMRGGGDHPFVDWLRNHGAEFVGSSGTYCWNRTGILSCAWEEPSGRLIGCRVDCY